MNPDWQVQIGLWLTTRQTEFCPHGFGHGSIHFWFRQAKFNGHSELILHSGLQSGGDPLKSGKQVHTACPLFSLQLLFGPQGDGVHGRVGVTVVNGTGFCIIYSFFAIFLSRLLAKLPA